MSISVTFVADDTAELRTHMFAFLGASATVSEMPAPTDKPTPRGRPRKQTEEVAPPVAPAESQADAAAKVAARIAAVSTESSGAISPPTEAAPAIDKDTVRKPLIEVVKKHGVEKCTELCMKYGGASLSAVAEEHWPALLADAQALLATE